METLPSIEQWLLFCSGKKFSRCKVVISLLSLIICTLGVNLPNIQDGASCKKCFILGGWQGSEYASVANELIPLKSWHSHSKNLCPKK